MTQRGITIILSLALVVAFFLPYTGDGIVRHTGYDYAVSFQVGVTKSALFLLIPLAAAMLLFGALDREKYPLGRRFWTWVSLLTVIFFIYKKIKFRLSFNLGDFIEELRYGFWITLAASLILVLYKRDKE